MGLTPNLASIIEQTSKSVFHQLRAYLAHAAANRRQIVRLDLAIASYLGSLRLFSERIENDVDDQRSYLDIAMSNNQYEMAEHLCTIYGVRCDALSLHVIEYNRQEYFDLILAWMHQHNIQIEEVSTFIVLAVKRRAWKVLKTMIVKCGFRLDEKMMKKSKVTLRLTSSEHICLILQAGFRVSQVERLYERAHNSVVILKGFMVSRPHHDAFFEWVAFNNETERMRWLWDRMISFLSVFFNVNINKKNMNLALLQPTTVDKSGNRRLDQTTGDMAWVGVVHQIKLMIDIHNRVPDLVASIPLAFLPLLATEAASGVLGVTEAITAAAQGDLGGFMNKIKDNVANIQGGVVLYALIKLIRTNTEIVSYLIQIMLFILVYPVTPVGSFVESAVLWYLTEPTNPASEKRLHRVLIAYVYHLLVTSMKWRVSIALGVWEGLVP
ncbi:hypothetical protein HDU81_009812, partial [Chytriomyces hyalinus]